MNYAAVECPPKVGVAIVGGGILDAPYDGTACKWGVKDAAPYALSSIVFCYWENGFFHSKQILCILHNLPIFSVDKRTPPWYNLEDKYSGLPRFVLPLRQDIFLGSERRLL